MFEDTARNREAIAGAGRALAAGAQDEFTRLVLLEDGDDVSAELEGYDPQPARNVREASRQLHILHAGPAAERAVFGDAQEQVDESAILHRLGGTDRAVC